MPLAEREKILNQLKKMLIEKEGAFLNSLQEDLGKPHFESYTSKIAVLLNEIDFVLKHLKKWMKPKKSFHFKLGYLEKLEKTRHSYGHDLIISPWN